MFNKRTSVTGGWREREKAREESWGPPRGDSQDNGDDADGAERSSDRFRDRRPQRSHCYNNSGCVKHLFFLCV